MQLDSPAPGVGSTASRTSIAAGVGSPSIDSRPVLVQDHIAEHHLVRARLNELGTAALRAAIAGLREHLEAEERYLLARDGG